MTWLDLFKSIITRRKERELLFGKQFAWLALGTAALAASGIGPTLNVKTAIIEFQVPKVYLAFLLAAMVSFTLLECLGILLIGECQRRIANRLIVGRLVATNSLAIPFYAGSTWVEIFLSRYTLFLYPQRFKVATSVAILLILLPAALIVLGAYTMIVVQVAQYFVLPSNAFMGWLFGVTAVAMLATPIVFYAVAFTPIPLKKHTFSVRWGLLFPMYRRDGVIPDHVGRWV